MNENGNGHDDLQIDVERVGRGPEAVAEARRASLEHPAVRERLRGKRSRLLSVQFLEPVGRGKADEAEDPDGYRATRRRGIGRGLAGGLPAIANERGV